MGSRRGGETRSLVSHPGSEERRVPNNPDVAKGTGAGSSWESGRVPSWTLRQGQDLRVAGGWGKQEGRTSSSAGAGRGGGWDGLEQRARAPGSRGKRAGPPGERLWTPVEPLDSILQGRSQQTTALRPGPVSRLVLYIARKLRMVFIFREGCKKIRANIFCDT